jgi:hypothetical protein
MRRMYFVMFQQMKKQLGHIHRWLDTATAYATSKKFDPNVFAALRLAPDQFPLSRQIQIACDTTKLGVSRMTGKEAPSQPDTEQTLDELRARVTSAIAYLDTLVATDFDGIAERTVTNPRWEGKVMTAHDYFVEHVNPNFHFHLTHVYAILRHNGVELGKKDFLGPLTQRLP